MPRPRRRPRPRDLAIAAGQHAALELLLRRLTVDGTPLPAPPADSIAGMVAGFEIDGELVSTTRYRASLTVDFDPTEVRRLLRDSGVAYAETVSKPGPPRGGSARPRRHDAVGGRKPLAPGVGGAPAPRRAGADPPARSATSSISARWTPRGRSPPIRRRWPRWASFTARARWRSRSPGFQAPLPSPSPPRLKERTRSARTARPGPPPRAHALAAPDRGGRRPGNPEDADRPRGRERTRAAGARHRQGRHPAGKTPGRPPT